MEFSISEQHVYDTEVAYLHIVYIATVSFDAVQSLIYDD
jgi:hypothetical protein